jgi:NTE family protein
MAEFHHITRNTLEFRMDGISANTDCILPWKKKNIVTFGDIGKGIPDKLNPKGRRIRMTAVDANRGKVIVLPDDMTYYGIDPDRFEVAKAVRMSTSVPFAFKPVKITFEKDGIKKTHSFVDGGVLDSLPGWLVTSSIRIPSVGFVLDGGKKKLFSLDTPIKILKGLYIATHDIGVPEDYPQTPFLAKIDTQDVSFLDFGIDEKDKIYLYNAGLRAGNKLFDMIRKNILHTIFGRFTR